MIKMIFFDAEGVLFRKVNSDAECVSKILGVTEDKYDETLAKIIKDHANFIDKNQHIPTINHEILFLSQLHRILCDYLNIVSSDSLIETLNQARLKPKFELFLGVEDGLKDLRKIYDLAIVTNSFPSRRHNELSIDGIGKYFKKIYIAYELGIKKPSTKIFDYAINDLGVKKDEVVYIDNKMSNLQGALNSGILNVILVSQSNNHNEIKSVSSFTELLHLLLSPQLVPLRNN